MKGRNSVAVQKSAAASLSRAPAGLLQRQCACGQHTHGGECEQCKKKPMPLQRKSENSSVVATAPPIVNDVLRSPGQPLEPATRAFMEPHFGYDFGQVRVHADERAAESARAVRANAYTVAQHVVFGSGRYNPRSSGGQQLIAHELTHVVQQQSGMPLATEQT